MKTRTDAGEPGRAPGVDRYSATPTQVNSSPHRAIESGSLDEDDDLDTEFNFGLERILDGIESLIDQSGERPGGG